MSQDQKIRAFIANAQKFAGFTYQWNGGHTGVMAKPGPVDCTGLVLQAALAAGIINPSEYPAGTAAVYKHCKRLGWKRGQPPDQLQPGDIVASDCHVGIYLGNGLMIDAPGRGRKIAVRKFIPSLFTHSYRPQADKPQSGHRPDLAGLSRPVPRT